MYVPRRASSRRALLGGIRPFFPGFVSLLQLYDSKESTPLPLNRGWSRNSASTVRRDGTGRSWRRQLCGGGRRAGRNEMQAAAFRASVRLWRMERRAARRELRETRARSCAAVCSVPPAAILWPECCLQICVTHVLLVGDGLAGESAGTEAPQVLPACCLRLFPARVFALFCWACAYNSRAGVLACIRDLFVGSLDGRSESGGHWRLCRSCTNCPTRTPRTSES